VRRRLNLDLAAVIAIGAAGTVWINALWLQEGRHPAPLFAAAPQASQTQTRIEAAAKLRELQSGLRDLGFYDGPVDGIDGPRTRLAIAAYRKAHGLDAAGSADEALRRHVRLASRDAPPVPPVLPVLPGPLVADEEGRILAVQKVLAELGYAPGRVDGRLGSQTRAAIMRFEQDNGLKATGEVSPALLRRLEAISGAALEATAGRLFADDRLVAGEPAR
jgi:peptidoglycan hydrolase-like protein with peptidoglycan-binding domain